MKKWIGGIHLHVVLNMHWDFSVLLQVVASQSGQWCFGVLLNFPVTWWFRACARLQQLRTFGGAHSSQPNPWHSLRRHSSCECLSPAPSVDVHSANSLLRVSLSGLHRGRLYVEPSRPGSYRREQSRERSCTSGHAGVPTRFQRELDTSSYSKRWEDFNSAVHKHWAHNFRRKQHLE